MKALLITFLVGIFIQAHAQQAQVKKNYPGAYDEEDLVVQTELVPPQQKYNRETQEETVRKNLFKKDEKEAPTQE